MNIYRIIRGTTPTHEFEIPFDTSYIKDVVITYSQESNDDLVKYKTDCTFTENKVIVKLTQEDTLSFDSTQRLSAEVKILAYNGEVVIGDKIYFAVIDTNNEEVL